MDFKSAFNNKTILIPVLQRDYVQGASETVIDPFLDSLLNSDCDLNYIYGYSENDCFIPVDGQQRLITLWLLHLYIHSRKNVRGAAFKVALKFQTREYATEFCSRLSEKMGELLLKAKDCQLLDNEIEDQNWFISSWKKNATVANMLRTLRYIHKKVKEENVDAVYQRFFQGISPVSFAFLDMTEENGLKTDDGFKYTVEDDEVTIKGYEGSKTTLTIPSEIDGKKVTKIGANAFDSNTSITSVDFGK